VSKHEEDASLGSHRAVMLEEALRFLAPSPGELAVDCTLGGGGHARALLSHLRPGGRLLGLDVDPLELARAEATLRAEGFSREELAVRHASFARLPEVLAAAGMGTADLLIADLGVSSMQVGDPGRGFSYKGVGPLDMRMDPTSGEPATELLLRLEVEELAALLEENADEPHARLIAELLKQKPLATTHAAERQVRLGLNAALPQLTRSEVKMSLRRTFQALRIAVNDELSSLDALLQALPRCLSPGGRVVVITFHSGEDRRVKKAFQVGQRAGVYSQIATRVVRSTKEETFANRRAASAKLRWAVRAKPRPAPG
jgi:16S rRNA (cytosine1402-N4)-methyltransferase